MKFASTLSAITLATTLAAAPAMATDWTGFYVGGQLGYSDVETSSASGDDVSFGIQAGYDHQFSNNMVLGGEVAYSYSDTSLSRGQGDFKDSIALKGRLGYAHNDFLFYGTAGIVRGEVDGGSINSSDNGVVYGVGMEYMISQQVSLGFEVLQSEYDSFGNSGRALRDTSAAVKVNYRF